MHLGKNHFDYGVRPSDFEHFEEALIYCLEKEIKNDTIFDLATKASWKKQHFWAFILKILIKSCLISNYANNNVSIWEGVLKCLYSKEKTKIFVFFLIIMINPKK
ncbi:hypothetical protein BpHYR1_045486 [Brachionus plicatilis]|uniref:Uncharacterized protein n=1 Tax=Brachionus plicatilis TaxID=10195 RepID=A0A3M7PYP6_BRAPC|nr:hypothetical protein BpHYR1_045486 [Brachionus plicatilis]